MAADTRKIIIELKFSDGEAQETNSASSEQVGSGSSFNLSQFLDYVQHPIRSLEKATLGKNILVYQTYQYAKSMIKSVSLYAAERYFNLTENYKAEQTLQNTMSVIEHVSGIGTTIIGSAVTGAMGGFKVGGGYGAAAGAAIGATVGAGMAGINTIVETFKAWDQQKRSLLTMNIQSSFQQTRLGLIDDGRGTMY